MKVVCSPTRFAAVVQRLSPAHKIAIKEAGLEGMLYMKPIFLRRLMLVQISKRYILGTKNFRLGGKEIPMTPLNVFHIMGLQIEGTTIDISHVKEINSSLFNAYKSKIPGENQITIKALEKSIITSKEPDDHFIRQFVLYTIGLILAPTVKEYVNSTYLAIVEDMKKLSEYNWGKFTWSNLLDSIHKFEAEDQVSLQGNLAFLQVRSTLWKYHVCNYSKGTHL